MAAAPGDKRKRREKVAEEDLGKGEELGKKEEDLAGLPTQRSKVGHTSILLTFARFWPKGMEVRPPCVPSYF